MYYPTTYVPKVPGLKGSDRARAQNLDMAWPHKPIGGQPLFGGFSPSGGAGAQPGGSVGGCGSQTETGNSSGGGNGVGNDMSPNSLNPCFPDGPPPYRPPYCTNICSCPPPGGPSGHAGLGSKSPCDGGGL